jgi:hypothetical protein
LISVKFEVNHKTLAKTKRLCLWEINPKFFMPMNALYVDFYLI